MLVFKRSFLREAEFVDFKLPLAVRFNRSNGQGGYEPSDDQLEITWDDAANPWPLGAPAAVQTTMLSGRFTMEADFGGDATGSGTLGDMETFQGNAITMTATPFTIAEFDPTCISGPKLVVEPDDPIVVSSAGGRYGVMNMFAQTIRGTLNLRMTFASDVTANCGDAASRTPTVDNSSAPPMPIAYDGQFVISPSITADGKIRLGRITVDNAVKAQRSTFAFVRACTGPITCDAAQFPARLKIKTMTAEVLLGDLGP